jgi:hypothetical protein
VKVSCCVACKMGWVAIRQHAWHLQLLFAEFVFPTQNQFPQTRGDALEHNSNLSILHHHIAQSARSIIRLD